MTNNLAPALAFDFRISGENEVIFPHETSSFRLSKSFEETRQMIRLSSKIQLQNEEVMVGTSR